MSASITPSNREEAARCVEVLDRFVEAKQALFADSLALFACDRLEPINVAGTLVSVQPDLVVNSTFPPQSDVKFGMIFIRPQKTPDVDGPKTSETRDSRREYRREAARYMLTLAQMAVVASGVSKDSFDPRRSFVWDIRLGEAIPFPSDWVSRQKNIEAAGRMIRRLWDTIEPSTSLLRK
ncbi:hypothetical protein [Paragemmobacter ruber]|uniref:Uncharacterized protein n=1 Tax=Paragemmobacter ruber TaxID=1985673 RepID=A0ABW9Y7Y3_9RHOB|nr:hypothetical protein [Rhodobacter ruber]NBE07939.1 hypothetical protein [Rhodobacter ruber]